MKAKKKKYLEASGWRVGSAKEFLGLSEEEAAYVELKLALSENIRKRLQQKKFTQVELAKLLKSSRSRVAKMEAGDPSVSIDFFIRVLLALGTTTKDLAKIILQQEHTALAD